MIRVRVTVSANCGPVYPGAMIRMMPGARRTPARVNATKMKDSSRMADCAISKASVFPLRVRYWAKTGTKAMLREPSANSRRSRLGMRKATKKASAIHPAPKNQAITISRMNPMIRLSSVAAPITPAARATRWFSFICKYFAGGYNVKRRW